MPRRSGSFTPAHVRSSPSPGNNRIFAPLSDLPFEESRSPTPTSALAPVGATGVRLTSPAPRRPVSPPDPLAIDDALERFGFWPDGGGGSTSPAPSDRSGVQRPDRSSQRSSDVEGRQARFDSLFGIQEFPSESQRPQWPLYAGSGAPSEQAVPGAAPAAPTGVPRHPRRGDQPAGSAASTTGRTQRLPGPGR